MKFDKYLNEDIIPKETNEAQKDLLKIATQLHGKKRLDLLQKVGDMGAILGSFADKLKKYYDDGTLTRQEFSRMTRIFDTINDQLNDIYDIL